MKTDSISRSNQNDSELPIRLLFAAWLITAIVTAGACRSFDETAAIPEALPLPSPTVQTTPVPAATPKTVKKSAVPFPRLEAALKRNVALRLRTWKQSIEERDLEKHLQHYAEQIETFYLVSNINRDFVRADRERAIEQFDELKLEIINIDIFLEDSISATVTFDKSWDFRKDESFSNGLVQQEIKMRKIENQWLIVSEKDLQVYRYRNQ